MQRCCNKHSQLTSHFSFWRCNCHVTYFRSERATFSDSIFLVLSCFDALVLVTSWFPLRATSQISSATSATAEAIQLSDFSRRASKRSILGFLCPMPRSASTHQRSVSLALDPAQLTTTSDYQSSSTPRTTQGKDVPLCQCGIGVGSIPSPCEFPIPTVVPESGLGLGVGSTAWPWARGRFHFVNFWPRFRARFHIYQNSDVHRTAADGAHCALMPRCGLCMAGPRAFHVRVSSRVLAQNR